MARDIITLCAYKVGPSAKNLSTPIPFPIHKNEIGSPDKPIKTTSTLFGSILKPMFKRAGCHKVQVFETPEQISTQIDPSTAGADANTAVAAAGTNQGGATLLSRYYNVVTSAAAASAEGVRLPAATPGKVFVVVNADASGDDVKVYPATGENINALADNIHLAVPVTKTYTFACFTAGFWKAVAWG